MRPLKFFDGIHADLRTLNLAAIKQMNAKCFIGSHVVLYLTDGTSSKNAKAKELFSAKPVISVQVVFKCLNASLKN